MDRRAPGQAFDVTSHGTRVVTCSVSDPPGSTDAGATQPRTIAVATVTNAATLNAASYIVTVQTATGASVPAAGVNGITVQRFAAGQCPTVAFNLPNATPGTTVWFPSVSLSV